MKILAALLAAAALSSSLDSSAQTPPCGSVVRRSITLNADLQCPAGWDALTIGADRVRINLNGFSIVGPPPVIVNYGTVAIRSTGFDNAQVYGPGHIRGFETAIAIDGGRGHQIQSTYVDDAGPIVLSNVSASRVLDSIFARLYLESGSIGQVSAGNEISRNSVGARQGGGIFLSGCGTMQNRVAGNNIQNTVAYTNAITISGGAARNEVVGNWSAIGAILLEDAPQNLIQGNTLKMDPSVWSAISIRDPIGNTTCFGIRIRSTENQVIANEVSSGGIAVFVDASWNLITGNYFWDQYAWPLGFSTIATDNDARGNHYVPTPPTIEDRGFRNLWP